MRVHRSTTVFSSGVSTCSARVLHTLLVSSLGMGVLAYDCTNVNITDVHNAPQVLVDGDDETLLACLLCSTGLLLL